MRIKTIFRYTMYTMFILLSMTSCHWFNSEVETIYDRTVLVYIAADNNLSSWCQEDIDEITQAAADIPNNSRLFIYLDDKSLPRILTVEQQKGRRPICKTIHQYKEEHNSGNTETLRIAMEWITENSPSASYGLVLWSHGSSWLPAKAPAQRAICVDSGSWMEIKEIADVLAPFPCLDFILFDACFMQAIEVAYELRQTTNYIISSPAEIPGPGAPYHRLIAPMFSIPLNVNGIAEEYYREYQDNKIYVEGYKPDHFGVCLSVVDCHQLDNLATVTNEIITKYAHSIPSSNLSGVQRYYPRTSNTTPEYYDMNGYMHQLITDSADYDYWKSAFNYAVPYKRTTPQWFSDYTKGLENIVDMDSYGGISCYVPKAERSKLNKAFQSTSWYHAAGWEEIGW